MANELRKRVNCAGGLVDNVANLLTAGTTLDSPDLASITNGVGATEHMAIILDPDGYNGAPEIVYITALTGGASTCTVLRAQEGTTARDHIRDIPWVHAPTVRDFQKTRKLVRDGQTATPTGDITITATGARFVVHSSITALGVHCEIGDIVRCTLSGSSKVSVNTIALGFDFFVDAPSGTDFFIGGANDYGVGAIKATDFVPISATGIYTPVVRGTHTFQPYWILSGAGTGYLGNAISGQSATSIDTLITFIVENLGPESA